MRGRPEGPYQPAVPTAIVIALLAGPVVLGLAGTLLPAFGCLPALGGTTVSLSPFRALIAEPGLAVSVALSLGTGLAATAVSLLLVVFFTASWLETPAFRGVTKLLSPLLSVPHAAAAIGLAFLVSPSGMIMRLLSPWATGLDRPPDVLIVHDPLGLTMTAGLVAKEVPFLFLMTLAALPQSDARRHMRIAANLGYGRISGFAKAVLPQVYRQIRLPVLAVLAYSTSVVDVAEILGPTTPAPLAPRIIDWMSDPDPASRFKAAAGAVLQLSVTGFAILLWLCGEMLIARLAGKRYGDGRRYRRDTAGRWLSLGLVGILVSAMIGALCVLLLWSVSRGWWFPEALPKTLTTMHWSNLMQTGRHLVADTLLIALPVAAFSVALVIWLLEGWTRAGRSGPPAIRKLVFLPMVIPQISFLFGLQIIFLLANIDATYLAVGLAHLVFVLPYVFLALADPWRHLDPRFAKVSASLGSSPNRTLWKIRLPLMLRPILISAAIGFAVSIGQYLPTLMIGAGRIATVTTESVALASGGNRSIIAVYAMAQLLLPLAGFLLAALVPAVVFRHRLALSPER